MNDVTLSHSPEIEQAAPVSFGQPTFGCDRPFKNGRRRGKACGAPGTHYDAASQHNLCGLHARDCSSANLGHGKSWWELGCETHPKRRASRINDDGRRRCSECSTDYELESLRAYKRAIGEAA